MLFVEVVLVGALAAAGIANELHTQADDMANTICDIVNENRPKFMLLKNSVYISVLRCKNSLKIFYLFVAFRWNK